MQCAQHARCACLSCTWVHVCGHARGACNERTRTTAWARAHHSARSEHALGHACMGACSPQGCAHTLGEPLPLGTHMHLSVCCHGILPQACTHLGMPSPGTYGMVSGQRCMHQGGARMSVMCACSQAWDALIWGGACSLVRAPQCSVACSLACPLGTHLCCTRLGGCLVLLFLLTTLYFQWLHEVCYILHLFCALTI